MQIIPAIDGLDDASQTRIVLYQSGRFVHAPALGIGLQPLDATLTALINGTIDPSKAYRRGNILGTVSQSSGTPTGAIIERGSTASGEYVRFADGTQICTTRDAGGNSGTWAATFSVTPYAVATPITTLARMATLSRSTTGYTLMVWTDAGSSSVVSCDIIAIGRWF